MSDLQWLSLSRGGMGATSCSLRGVSEGLNLCLNVSTCSSSVFLDGVIPLNLERRTLMNTDGEYTTTMWIGHWRKFVMVKREAHVVFAFWWWCDLDRSCLRKRWWTWLKVVLQWVSNDGSKLFSYPCLFQSRRRACQIYFCVVLFFYLCVIVIV